MARTVWRHRRKLVAASAALLAAASAAAVMLAVTNTKPVPAPGNVVDGAFTFSQANARLVVDLWLPPGNGDSRTLVQQVGPMLEQLRQTGRVTVRYPIVATADTSSREAATAIACATNMSVQSGSSLLNVVVGHGPGPLTGGELIMLATAQGVVGQPFADCVKSAVYYPWVVAHAGDGQAKVQLNGADVSVDQLRAAVEKEMTTPPPAPPPPPLNGLQP